MFNKNKDCKIYSVVLYFLIPTYKLFRKTTIKANSPIIFCIKTIGIYKPVSSRRMYQMQIREIDN